MLSEEAIFNEALSLQNPTERDAYLAVACGNDTHLRRRVQELIEAYDRGGFLERPLDVAGESSVFERIPHLAVQPLVIVLLLTVLAVVVVACCEYDRGPELDASSLRPEYQHQRARHRAQRHEFCNLHSDRPIHGSE